MKRAATTQPVRYFDSDEQALEIEAVEWREKRQAITRLNGIKVQNLTVVVKTKKDRPSYIN